MPSSEAPSKSKKSRLKLWLPAAAALVVLLVLALGPSLFLRLTLARLVPADSGLSLSYDRARAGFMLRSAEVSGLALKEQAGEKGPPLLNFKRLRLEGVSTWNLIKFLRQSELPAKAMFLAEETYIDGLYFNNGQVELELAEAHLRGLQFRPGPAPGELPLLFDKLEMGGLSLDSRLAQLGLQRLEARNLAPEFLAGLSLRNFHYEYALGPDEGRDEFRFDALSLGGLRLEAVRRMLAGETAGQLLWSLLAGCDTLELVRGALNRSGSEALNLSSVSFDSVSRPGGATGFLRRLDLSLDLPALSGQSREPFWVDLRDITGDRFQAALNLEIDYHPGPGRAELKSALVDLPELGRLELTGALGGVQPVKSHHSPSQLLLSTRDWSLESLNLSFEDRGLAANFYRHLDRSVFRDAPSRQSAANIMNYIVRPLALDLEYEQGLDNLPALLSEVEAFLQRPRQLRLKAEPSPPLPLMPVINSMTFMSLANQGKYDIIEKLRLTLAVNERAPIFVAVASGVFKENLPLAPRPMEKAFDEESIIEEDL